MYPKCELRKLLRQKGTDDFWQGKRLVKQQKSVRRRKMPEGGGGEGDQKRFQSAAGRKGTVGLKRRKKNN